MLHAHMEFAQRDCDGLVADSALLISDENEDEYDFLNRVMRNVASVYSAGRLDVSTFDDGSTRFTWAETTEEGFISREATTCTDEGCDPTETTHYDEYAEAAGY